MTITSQIMDHYIWHTVPIFPFILEVGTVIIACAPFFVNPYLVDRKCHVSEKFCSLMQHAIGRALNKRNRSLYYRLYL